MTKSRRKKRQAQIARKREPSKTTPSKESGSETTDKDEAMVVVKATVGDEVVIGLRNKDEGDEPADTEKSKQLAEALKKLRG